MGARVRLALVALTARALVTALTFVSFALGGAFDTSAGLVWGSAARGSTAQALLRWDALYFTAIAERGYSFEHELAFMPGVPLLMSVSARLGLTSALALVVFGAMASTACSVAATVLFFSLTLALTDRRDFATVSTLLLILTPSPATFHAAPYTEPVAALSVYGGMLFFVKRKPWAASLVWGCGTLARAQNVVLGFGFFGWSLLQGMRQRVSLKAWTRLVALFMARTFISAAPFLAFQAWAAKVFCRQDVPRQWCSSPLAMSYGQLQADYWNVGPFRYWTLQQLPNFLLASPVLLVSVAASWDVYRRHPAQVAAHLVPWRPCWEPKQRSMVMGNVVFPATALAPFIHLNTALTAMLLVNSHVQIALRLLVLNPTPFWYLASQMTLGHGTAWTRRWVTYATLYGTCSIVLWAAFLPPA